MPAHTPAPVAAETAVDETPLTFDEILALDDLPTRTVRIPEWGNRPVVVGTLTQAERTAAIAAATVGDGKGGERIDSELLDKYTILAALKAPQLTSLEQVNALWQRNHTALERIRLACVRHNRLDLASQEAILASFRATA